MNPAHKENGDALIGLIIAAGILSILTLTIATLMLSSYDLLNYTSSRTTAKYIANEQMEMVRNLPFNSVGTIGGIPPGVIVQDQSTQRNGQNYTIKTRVIYVDDPFDNTAPNDLLPYDYKRVRVDVSWSGLSPSRGAPVTLITDIAPRGVETVIGGGTISILVFDSNGNPVPNAQVRIVATTVSPPVDYTINTGDNGRIILPGAPACNSCYQITVTKSGHSTDRTYSTSEIVNPAKPHLTIIQSELTETSFAIDRTSTLTINSLSTRESGFAPLANQSFNLRGGKIIGTTALDQPVYKYDEDLVTDVNGNLVLENMEWDTYQFTSTNTSYDLTGTNSLMPIVLLANSPQTFRYASAPNSQNSLLATFVDSTRNPIASVSAELKLGGAPVATVSSGTNTDPDFGQSFFSNLLAQTYELVATISGYATYSANINVTGDSKEEIILIP